MKKILIIFAHPAIQKSIINKTLVNAVSGLDGVVVNNLYENYPDFFIDIAKEQRMLLENDVIIWHHPFYWYNAPALFKEWMDLVLQHGFAYGSTGRALEGKWVMSAISTGGTQEVYSKTGSNRFSVNEFLAPFNRSATLCRMLYLPPFVTYGSHTISTEKLKQHAEAYAEVITGLRDNKFNVKDFFNAESMNHLIAKHA
jgi:glutathione-regulated potassium-efflux system ancillary protein KefG